MDLWGSFLTFDDVIPVTGVLDELVAVWTLLDCVFPLVISNLSEVTTNKVTGITAVLTLNLKVHAVVVLVTGVTILMRNWMYTFII